MDVLTYHAFLSKCILIPGNSHDPSALSSFPAHSHPSHCVDAIVIPQPSGESSGTNPSGATPRLSDGSSGTTPSGATPGPSGESTQPSSYDQLQLFERCYEESYDVYEYQDYLSWLEIPTS